mgnify:CR=1 FL=1
MSRASVALERVRAVFASPDVTAAFATTAIGAAVLAVPIRSLIGDTGWATIVITLALIATAALIARGRDSRSPTILPITVIVAVGWAVLSLAWTATRWATIGSLIPLVGLAIVGIAIATVRDQVQILRAVADVARFALVLSLTLELLSGILLDTPFAFLGIDGNLAAFGPIQGIAGSSDRMGVFAVIAAITFGVEWFTRAIPRGLSLASMIAATLVFAFASSGVAAIVVVAVGVAVGLLVLLRRVSGATRRAMNWAIIGLLGMVALVSWTIRGTLIVALDSSTANRDLVDLWLASWSMIDLKPVTGWGWIGQWDVELSPYRYIAVRVPGDPGSASNALLDLLLQLGVVGLLAFAAMAALAIVRTWRLASSAKPVIALWPPLVLIAVGAASVADSLVLADWGWLLLIIGVGIGSRRAGWGRTPPNPSARAEVPR